MLCLHDNDLEDLLNFFNEFAAQGPFWNALGILNA